MLVPDPSSETSTIFGVVVIVVENFPHPKKRYILLSMVDNFGCNDWLLLDHHFHDNLH